MGRVLTNNTGLSYAIEGSLGVAPTSGWKKLEPNNIRKYGAEIKTVSREPISNLRQRRKGTVVDLDSGVEFEADYTMEHLTDFIEGFCFAQFNGLRSTFRPTAVTTTAYTVAASGDLAQNTLVYARGFAVSGNNGLHVVSASATGTSLKAAGLATESSPPANAIVEVCGFRGTAGDLEINSSGNLISTTLDFTTLGLTVGQAIWIGGDSSHRFFQTANRGYARITAIAAHTLTLDKKSAVFVTDDGTTTGSGGTDVAIDIFFGRFARNVAVDDADFIERSIHFELSYPDLDNPSGDMYEYAAGNFCNTLEFNLPLANKATLALGFIGTDAQPPTDTRVSGVSSALVPLRTTALNTSADIARLRITEVDETGLTTDFKSLKLTLNNQVSPEKTLANLGATYMNTGNFLVDIEADLLFTNADVATAIRNNDTVSMDFAVRNDDGAMFVDIASMTLGDGSRDFPVNESVKIKVKGEAFQDTTLGTSIGISLFPYVPAS